jgi:hypothetical protein
MDFKTEAQKQCYERVGGFLKELFGETFVSTHKEAPVFRLKHGSAFAVVAVNAWTEDECVVEVRAYLVTEADLSKDLLLYLLRKNDGMMFGNLGIDREGDIFIHHMLVGSTLDKPELKHAVGAVLSLGDDLDDEIVSRFGGTRMIDRMLE